MQLSSPYPYPSSVTTNISTVPNRIQTNTGNTTYSTAPAIATGKEQQQQQQHQKQQQLARSGTELLHQRANALFGSLAASRIGSSFSALLSTLNASLRAPSHAFHITFPQSQAIVLSTKWNAEAEEQAEEELAWSALRAFGHSRRESELAAVHMPPAWPHLLACLGLGLAILQSHLLWGHFHETLTAGLGRIGPLHLILPHGFFHSLLLLASYVLLVSHLLRFWQCLHPSGPSALPLPLPFWPWQYLGRSFAVGATMMVSLAMMESPRKATLGCSGLSAMAWIAILISTGLEGAFAHRFAIALGLIAKGTVIKRVFECAELAPERKWKEVSLCVDHLHVMDGGCLLLCAFFPTSLVATIASSAFDVGVAWTGCLLLKRTDILFEALGYQSLRFLVETPLFGAATSSSSPGNNMPPASQTRPGAASLEKLAARGVAL